MRRAALIAVLAASVMAPTAAEAATVSQSYIGDSSFVDENGQTQVFRLYALSFQAAPGEANDVTFERVFDARLTVLVKDAGASLVAGENCHAADGGVECAPPTMADFSGPAQIDLGDGDDRVSDRILESPTVHGGPGADDLTSTEYATLDGGPGPDRMTGTIVTYADRTAPVNVSMDGVANDGETGEGDNVSAEQLIGGRGDDTLVGNGFRNYLDGGPGRDTIDAGAGDDAIVGDPSGADSVDGGPGDDQLAFNTGQPVRVSLDPRFGDSTYTHGYAIERLFGGKGADTLIGSDAGEEIWGNGGEEIVGNGPGDSIYAMGGDDRVTSSLIGGSYIDPGSGKDGVVALGRGDQAMLRDGERDFLGCRDGKDQRVVEHDRADAIACSPFQFFRRVGRVRASRRGSISVPLACPPGDRCEGVVALRWQGRTIRTQAFDRFPGSESSLRFTLGKLARAALARGRRLPMRVALTVRLHAEPAPAHATARRITVLPPARKRR
jgi:Ca2+-binding RTX toxin-like protein